MISDAFVIELMKDLKFKNGKGLAMLARYLIQF